MMLMLMLALMQTNVDIDAIIDDGFCDYPDTGYNCSGDCIVDFDCDGVCGEKSSYFTVGSV